MARCQAVYALFDGVDHFTVGFVPRVREIAAGADGAEQVERKSLALFNVASRFCCSLGTLGQPCGQDRKKNSAAEAENDRSAVARQRPCAAVADACAVDRRLLHAPRGLPIRSIIASVCQWCWPEEKQIVERFGLYANQSGVEHVAKGGYRQTCVHGRRLQTNAVRTASRMSTSPRYSVTDVSATLRPSMRPTTRRIQSLQYAADAVRGVSIEYVVEHHAADGEGFAPAGCRCRR